MKIIGNWNLILFIIIFLVLWFLFFLFILCFGCTTYLGLGGAGFSAAASIFFERRTVRPDLVTVV